MVRRRALNRRVESRNADATDRVDEAIDAYTRAIDLAPDDGAAEFRLGRAQIGLANQSA